MSVSKNERLSAMVDDESHSFELKRISDELLQNPDDLARWERYHLIGDAMRGHSNLRLEQNFAYQIMERINDEPAYQIKARPFRLRHAKPVLGFGMAAAVAVAVLVGMQNFLDSHILQPVITPSMAEIQRSDEFATVRMSPPPSSSSEENSLSVPDARFNTYIINHAEHTGGRGIMPYVRIVGYEAVGE